MNTLEFITQINEKYNQAIPKLNDFKLQLLFENKTVLQEDISICLEIKNISIDFTSKEVIITLEEIN